MCKNRFFKSRRGPTNPRRGLFLCLLNVLFFLLLLNNTRLPISGRELHLSKIDGFRDEQTKRGNFHKNSPRRAKSSPLATRAKQSTYKGHSPGQKEIPPAQPQKSQLLTTVFLENSPKVAPYLAVPPTIVRVLALSQT